MSDGSVDIKDLVKTYVDDRGRPTFTAVKKINLHIDNGEFMVLVGPSGCGKTTWLKCLLRLTHPCAGRVELGGVPLEQVSREAIGRLIGYVGQAPFVFAGTIAENIAYGSGLSSAQAIQRAAELAWHFMEGDDLERAFHYATMAGDLAEAMWSHDDAASHYSNALELAQQIPSLLGRIVH